MILADTQVVVWLTLEPSKLSRRAASAVAQGLVSGSGNAIASTTLWELALLANRERIRPRIPMREYLRSVEAQFTVLPITADVAERSIQFSPKYPKDPADRIIGATALIHGLSLITADAPIRKSGEVPCIW